LARELRDGPSGWKARRLVSPPSSCSHSSGARSLAWLRFLESSDAREEYDFTTDVLSDFWDPRAAIRKVRRHPGAQIADVLLDQSIFGGVGNIIKNEVLFRTRLNPFAKVSSLPPQALRRIVEDARVFSFRFLDLRREFALRKNLEIYGRSACSRCGGKVRRRVHGSRKRRSFFCLACQGVRPPRESRPKKRKKERIP
jgi:endonuclease-8